MGGTGSGRKPYTLRLTTADYRRIDVRKLHRDLLLVPGVTAKITWKSPNRPATHILHLKADTDGLWLNSGGETWEYFVPLSTTPCFKGGERHWFHCPVSACHRRVAILFGGAVFRCRYCNDLSYPSQREGEVGQIILRMNRLRDQLKWPGDILEGALPKAKGMHWKTFARLSAEYDRLNRILLARAPY